MERERDAYIHSYIVYCIVQKQTAALKSSFYRTLQLNDTSSCPVIGTVVPTVPIECSFWNETAMTTVHKCSTFHGACSSNQKGQTNTVHNTGGLNEHQAAKAREAKLDLPLGPNMNTAARHPDFHHMSRGKIFPFLWDTSPHKFIKTDKLCSTQRALMRDSTISLLQDCKDVNSYSFKIGKQ